MRFLDASSNKIFTPAVENLTVAVKDPTNLKPDYRYLCFSLSFLLGNHLRTDWPTNLDGMSSKSKGSSAVATAFQGLIRLSCHLVLLFLLSGRESQRKASHGKWMACGNMDCSRYILPPYYRFVENCVLSMCGGSGSLMETCMQVGRSCIMFEKNGLFSMS